MPWHELTPVATLILGYFGSVLSEQLRDRRAREREATARAEERRVRIDDRRVEFQRQTLIELQVAAQRLARAAGRAQHADEMAYRQAVHGGTGATYGSQLLPENVSDECLATSVEVTRHMVRVADGDARGLAQAFRDATVRIELARDVDAARSAMTDAI